jgi:hypothetical protein
MKFEISQLIEATIDDNKKVPYLEKAQWRHHST